MLSNLSLVTGLVVITKPPLPVDIVHLSGANFLLLALCRYTFPSAFCFRLNTHLQSIAFFPAFESFSSNVTLHSSMWMPVARPSLSILFTAFGSRCPNRLCHVCIRGLRVQHLCYPARTRSTGPLPVPVPDPYSKSLPDPTRTRGD